MIGMHSGNTDTYERTEIRVTSEQQLPGSNFHDAGRQEEKHALKTTCSASAPVTCHHCPLEPETHMRATLWIIIGKSVGYYLVYSRDAVCRNRLYVGELMYAGIDS